jgi:hypothetical protein
MMGFDHSPKAHASRIRTGCPQHPEYKGTGAPPDPCCGRCLHIRSSWNQLTAAMNDLLKD